MGVDDRHDVNARFILVPDNLRYRPSHDLRGIIIRVSGHSGRDHLAIHRLQALVRNEEAVGVQLLVLQQDLTDVVTDGFLLELADYPLIVVLDDGRHLSLGPLIGSRLPGAQDLDRYLVTV